MKVNGEKIVYATYKGTIDRIFTFKTKTFYSVSFDNYSEKKRGKDIETYYNPIRALIEVK